MKVEGKPPFDAKTFLAKVETGKTKSELRKRQKRFSPREIPQMLSSTSRKAKSS